MTRRSRERRQQRQRPPRTTPRRPSAGRQPSIPPPTTSQVRRRPATRITTMADRRRTTDRVSALIGAFSPLAPREGRYRSWSRQFREQKCCTGPLSFFSPSRQARRQCVPVPCLPVGAVLSNTAWKDPEVRKPQYSLGALPAQEWRLAAPPQAAAHFVCSATNREAVELGRLSTRARGKRDRDRHQSH